MRDELPRNNDLDGRLPVAPAEADRRHAEDAAGPHPLLQNDMRLRALRRQMILNARLQREIAEVNREKERYALQVQQIYASQSWRLTAPLRYVVTKLRGR